MAAPTPSDEGPDLTVGVTLADFGGRQMLRGHVGKKSVLLAPVDEEILAVGAACTHYSGPLNEGALIGDTVRCPLHHACFSLRTGEALGARAFDPISCWKVERAGDRIMVREQVATHFQNQVVTDGHPKKRRNRRWRRRGFCLRRNAPATRLRRRPHYVEQRRRCAR
jgi:nitrite reductase/ring-hydroxylating ferredoxin subunit